MKIIDLTHTIYPDMPVYPGTEKPVFLMANTLEKEGFLEHKITMYSHTGTHMDAPAHIFKDGQTLDMFEPGRFIGTAAIADLTGSAGPITVQDLEPYKDMIAKADFFILKTGWSKYWDSEKYYEKFPAMCVEAAQWLTQFCLRGVGVDAISIDDIDSSDLPVHRVLLSKSIVIIENLTNLDLIRKDSFVLSALPLKIRNADGSPVRAVAIEYD